MPETTKVRRSPDEFRVAAKERGIAKWLNHDCALCGYPCSYLFYRFAEQEVLYDAGCNCVPNPSELRPSSWRSVAEHYNMQSNPAVCAEMDAFWGFAPAPEERDDATAVRRAMPVGGWAGERCHGCGAHLTVRPVDGKYGCDNLCCKLFLVPVEET